MKKEKRRKKKIKHRNNTTYNINWIHLYTFICGIKRMSSWIKTFEGHGKKMYGKMDLCQTKWVFIILY